MRWGRGCSADKRAQRLFSSLFFQQQTMSHRPTVQIWDTGHTFACELQLCYGPGSDNWVTASDPGITAIWWYSTLMPQCPHCGRGSNIQVGQREGLPWKSFSRALHGVCSFSLSDNMICSYPPVLNYFLFPISSFVFIIFNWNMADALDFRN